VDVVLVQQPTEVLSLRTVGEQAERLWSLPDGFRARVAEGRLAPIVDLHQSRIGHTRNRETTGSPIAAFENRRSLSRKAASVGWRSTAMLAKYVAPPSGADSIARTTLILIFSLRWIQKDLHLAAVSAYEAAWQCRSRTPRRTFIPSRFGTALGDVDFSAIYALLNQPSHRPAGESDAPLPLPSVPDRSGPVAA
jgi:hypothetical protein